MRQAVEAGLQHSESRVELAAFSFAKHLGNHGNRVGIALIVIVTLAFWPRALYDAPINQPPKAHACVAATYGEFVANLVHGERFRGDKQQRVDLGHRTVDSPIAAHSAPLLNESVERLIEFLAHRDIVRRGGRERSL